MAEFSFSGALALRNKKRSAVAGNIAYALFVLFCFWAGAQLLNTLLHAPGMIEHFIQLRDSTRPRVDIDLAVGTLFGLVPFLLGCLLFGGIALILNRRGYR